jgi:hypothetical protein
METPQLVCPKCQGLMEPGLVIDRGHYGVPAESQWLEGEPQYSWLGSLKAGGHKRKVTTFRCMQCGYLESYAQ